MKNIKLKWQIHNRDNGMSWNEIAELVNEVIDRTPKQSAKEYIESRKDEFNVNHIINRLEPVSLEALFYIMEQYDNLK